MLIGIQHDDYTKEGQPAYSDSCSYWWKRRLDEHGIPYQDLDLYAPDAGRQLAEVDAVMWRFYQMPWMMQHAMRVLSVAEHGLSIPVFPDLSMRWHYDDKASQAVLFAALNLPTPKTWVFTRRVDLDRWLSEHPFPFVIKLASGAGSSGVKLVETKSEAESFADRFFDRGLQQLSDVETLPLRKRIRRATLSMRQVVNPVHRMKNSAAIESDWHWPVHAGYLIAQELVPANAFDTRVTVIGDRVFAFRRYNRPNDFRASGSGLIDYDQDAVDLSAIKLAVRAARVIGSRCCAVDILRGPEGPLLVEVTYTFSMAAVAGCPGSWRIIDETGGQVEWEPGHIQPQYEQVDMFLKKLNLQQMRVA